MGWWRRRRVKIRLELDSHLSKATCGGADELLAEALDVLDTRFWDEDAGMVVEEWDEAWTTLDGYRGVNANMHTVEALLAVGDLARAERILTRVVHGFARDNDWRIPEHFDASWTPIPDYNRDEPAHPFRPYGATVGHWFEWSRLTLGLRAGLGDDAPGWMLDDAVALFDAGVREGWAVDGAAGFVLDTRVAGNGVYVMIFEVEAPPRVGEDELRAAVAESAREIGVSATVRALEEDVL